MFLYNSFFFSPIMTFFQSFLLTTICSTFITTPYHPTQANVTLPHLATHAPKKKIIIMTSKGGYGHQAATASLKKLLEPKFKITIVNPFEEVLHPLDIVKKITNNKLDGEQLYNLLLRKKWINTLNFGVGEIAPLLHKYNHKKIVSLFFDYFAQEKPDLIISVVPFVNAGALQAAEKHNIPYLLVTTDTDLYNWTQGMNKVSYSNFIATIGFDIKQTRERLLKCRIPNNKIKHTGFPLRDDFFTPKDATKIRDKWHIPPNKFIIMILMGGTGSSYATYTYVQKIAKANVNAHILACVGKDNEAQNQLNQLKRQFPNLSLTIIPFTTEIANLMSISNLLITKPGPGSIYEALHMELPMIVDYTSLPLYWEKASIQLVCNNKWGKALLDMRNVIDTIKPFMENKNYYSAVKNSLKKYKKKNFNKRIEKLIATLLKTTPSI